MPFEIPDDDLNADDLKSAVPPQFNTAPKPNGKTTGKVPSTPPVNPTAKNPVIKWGDSRIQAGDGLLRLKSTTERALRFTLVPGVDPVSNLTHYVAVGQKKGMFVCPGEAGCVLCPREYAKWNTVVLVAGYNNADAAGKLAAGVKPEYTIGYISLSPTHFKTLSDATETAGVFDIDWIQTSDGKRFNYRAMTSSRYRQAGDEAALIKLAQPFIARLNGKVGRTISALDLKAMVAGGPTIESGLGSPEDDE
jgi:hypothetical protein